MAMLIKDRYRLTTLRCRIGFRKDRHPNPARKSGFASMRVLRTQLYDGVEPVGEPRDTRFDQLGLTAEGYPPSRTWVPQFANTAIADQLRQAEQRNPAAIWLHIPQDSYPLALLPWEEIAAQEVHTPILRIGNFLSDPYTPSPKPRIAICASQPVGDGHYPLSAFVHALLRVIDDAAAHLDAPPRVSIFTDTRWSDVVQAGLPGGPRNLDVEIVVPPDAVISGNRTKRSDGNAPCTSVWLDWMAAHFAGEAVDIVHFITPGWYHENRGAIALAETPTHDRKGGGEFIGASTLAAFYDQLGCSAMAFSSPEMPQWEWGQRMLAFELSWLRPGPVLVFEHGVLAYPALTNFYALLLGRGADAIENEGQGPSPPQLTCHPKLLGETEFAPAAARGAAFVQDIEPDMLARHVAIAEAQLAPVRTMSMAEQWEAAGAAQALDFVKSLS
jgi:hypothetical protein